MGAKHYWELTAWQAVRDFKVGIYPLIERGPLANDFKLREQLRESVASAQSHIADGYGRFDPLDFDRFVKCRERQCSSVTTISATPSIRKRITEETRVAGQFVFRRRDHDRRLGRDVDDRCGCSDNIAWLSRNAKACESQSEGAPTSPCPRSSTTDPAHARMTVRSPARRASASSLRHTAPLPDALRQDQRGPGRDPEDSSREHS